MKDQNSIKISLLISGFFSLVFLILLLIISKFSLFQNKTYIFLLSVFAFILLTFLTYKIIRWFIVGKVTPIYNTIHNLNVSGTEIKEKEEESIIQTAEKEVINWAEEKKKEITHLKDMEKYRKEYLGNVSHELKTPIFNIQGYILTLLEGGIDDPKINRIYLERAEKSINRMISIVDDLGTISKLESEMLKLEKTRFNIVKLVEEVFETQEIRAKEYNVKLKHTYSSNIPLLVYADREKIFEVLNNLILNSINYGIRNGTTTVYFITEGNNIVVNIDDDGIGISNTDLPRLFERFYRVDRSRSRNLGGTGLGLAIVKHIIEAHKQTVNVSSKLKKGSTFSFTLEKA